MGLIFRIYSKALRFKALLEAEYEALRNIRFPLFTFYFSLFTSYFLLKSPLTRSAFHFFGKADRFLLNFSISRIIFPPMIYHY